ncbi:MAG: response regulator [Bacteroidales bacterium]|nr:response regulator [Bacteroidales bacterium]
MGESLNLENLSILVVEDDNMNYLYLQQIFKLTKGTFVRAKNGTEALEMAQNQSFDIILMDIQLPDISGTDVTREIRKFNPAIPIIAQTASRTPDETDDCLEAGCTDILIKPFTLNDFSRVLKKYL